MDGQSSSRSEEPLGGAARGPPLPLWLAVRRIRNNLATLAKTDRNEQSTTSTTLTQTVQTQPLQWLSAQTYFSNTIYYQDQNVQVAGLIANRPFKTQEQDHQTPPQGFYGLDSDSNTHRAQLGGGMLSWGIVRPCCGECQLFCNVDSYQIQESALDALKQSETFICCPTNAEYDEWPQGIECPMLSEKESDAEFDMNIVEANDTQHFDSQAKDCLELRHKRGDVSFHKVGRNIHLCEPIDSFDRVSGLILYLFKDEPFPVFILRVALSSFVIVKAGNSTSPEPNMSLKANGRILSVDCMIEVRSRTLCIKAMNQHYAENGKHHALLSAIPPSIKTLVDKSENLNILCATIFIEELTRGGLRHAVICPGSRSAPLCIAISRSRLPHTICVDERGAGFLALGYARTLGAPCAVVVSSGTAVANLLPATVEASQDHVPLLLLTADRPAELRDTAANQTINQAGLLHCGLGGSGLAWFKDVPSPHNGAALEPLLVDAAYAVACSKAPGASGPVHVNLQWREPLSPSQVPFDLGPLDSRRMKEWLRTRRPFTRYANLSGSNVVMTDAHGVYQFFFAEDAHPPCPFVHGVIVAGHLRSNEERLSVLALSNLLNWPIFADVRSGLRHDSFQGQSGCTIVSLYDLPMHCQELCSNTKFHPQVSLQFGDRLISKRLQAYTSYARNHILVAEHTSRADPTHSVTHRVQSSIVEFIAALYPLLEGQSTDTGRLMHWTRVSGRIRSCLNEKFPSTLTDSELLPCEVWITRQVCVALRNWPNSLIFSSNSGPIRHLDSYCDTSPLVFANRGASGIDGILHTSIGTALACSECSHMSNSRIAVLIGDLAFMHDLSALELLARLGKGEIPYKGSIPFKWTRGIVVVVLNNFGGGIFHTLPIAKHANVFSPYFDTPHGNTFQHLCSNFGINYRKIDKMSDFLGALEKAFHECENWVIEVITQKEDLFPLAASCADNASQILRETMCGM